MEWNENNHPRGAGGKFVKRTKVEETKPEVVATPAPAAAPQVVVVEKEVEHKGKGKCKGCLFTGIFALVIFVLALAFGFGTSLFGEIATIGYYRLAFVFVAFAAVMFNLVFFACYAANKIINYDKKEAKKGWWGLFILYNVVFVLALVAVVVVRKLGLF